MTRFKLNFPRQRDPWRHHRHDRPTLTIKADLNATFAQTPRAKPPQPISIRRQDAEPSATATPVKLARRGRVSMPGARWPWTTCLLQPLCLDSVADVQAVEGNGTPGRARPERQGTLACGLSLDVWCAAELAASVLGWCLHAGSRSGCQERVVRASGFCRTCLRQGNTRRVAEI